MAEILKKNVNNPDCHIVALTGPGISAESGNSNFRGEVGYWKIGSMNYTPAKLQHLKNFKHFIEKSGFGI